MEAPRKQTRAEHTLTMLPWGWLKNKACQTSYTHWRKPGEYGVLRSSHLVMKNDTSGKSICWSEEGTWRARHPRCKAWAYENQGLWVTSGIILLGSPSFYETGIILTTLLEWNDTRKAPAISTT
jgi:hypothetical protein